MSRSPVQLRSVREDDVPVLAELWADTLRSSDAESQIEDVRRVVAECRFAPLQRLVVAEYDGEVAGAVLLRVTSISPLNNDLVVDAVAPQVLPAYRRRGVGRALLETAVSWAEELGVAHVASAVLATSRDTHRFLARLGLGPQLLWRAAPTPAVRAKLLTQRTPVLSSTRQRERVLATRRLLRRERPVLG